MKNPRAKKILIEHKTIAKTAPITSSTNAFMSKLSHKKDISTTDKIALYIIGIVGTFEFFVICNILILIPFYFTSALPLVQFVSSGWLQLVLLPIIIISQNIDTRHNEKMEKKILNMERNIEKLLANNKK
jgi:hypothetical protein